MSDVQKRNREVLDAIQIRRDDFYEAILALEQALAAPAGDQPSAWAESLRAPVEHLRGVLEAHVSGTEGEGGLFPEIREHAPRLIHAMERLQADHDPLRDTAAALAASLDSVTDDADVDTVRGWASSSSDGCSSIDTAAPSWCTTPIGSTCRRVTDSPRHRGVPGPPLRGLRVHG